MNKLLAFVRLDFITIKPYLTIKNLLIFAVVAIFLTTMSGNISSGMSVGIMIGTLFISYPFAIGEKNNIDALYVTLSLDRKTVVAGRYLFTLAFNICAILFSIFFAIVGVLVTGATGLEIGKSDILLAGVLLAAAFIVIQSIQLPFFFKMGYTKAKFFSIVPFVALTTGYMVFMTASKENGIVSRIESVLEDLTSGLLVVLAVLALLLICYISYKLSLSFYKKREF
jgi:hypothetical protein